MDVAYSNKKINFPEIVSLAIRYWGPLTPSKNKKTWCANSEKLVLTAAWTDRDVDRNMDLNSTEPVAGRSHKKIKNLKNATFILQKNLVPIFKTLHI